MNDPLIHGLLDRTSAETIDQNNEKRRLEDQQESIFTLYQDVDDDVVEKRLPAEMPFEHMGHRFLVKCLQLKLKLEVEPIFASMAIYDAKERKKISENFYFDMNSENIKRMLTSHVPYTDISTQSRTAVFEVTNPSNDLFLVIRLEIVLQGVIKDSVEPYIKEDNEKYRDKAESNAADYSERLGKYRMPFAWTGIYLTNIFNGDGVESSKYERDRDTMGSATSSNSLDRKLSTSNFHTEAVELQTPLSRRQRHHFQRAHKCNLVFQIRTIQRANSKCGANSRTLVISIICAAKLPTWEH